MSSTTQAVALGLQRLEEAKKPFLAGDANSTEAVLDAARAILLAGGREQDRALASLGNRKEKASDFMQRVMWAEVSNFDGRQTTATFPVTLVYRKSVKVWLAWEIASFVRWNRVFRLFLFILSDGVSSHTLSLAMSRISLTIVHSPFCHLC